ncbi:DnaJ domain-containing protein [Cyclospora cayetanensis]|uniref:DnaJ domain-containing protein n=1 Tax=Cyclospora cayetanensis TaxID=88456 RepID=A0A1D3D839_9EIME|nr:DnaJ domain-containing protein [Cyclospora cayetanensis]
MLGSADEILQQSVLYGALTVVLLSPRVSQLLPQQQRKWLSYLRKPILSAVLMYLAYLPVATPRVNFYAMLEVGIHASKNDILQGYRNVSKKYHPDRVAASGLMPPLAGSSTPEEYFMDLKKAQEVLTHDIRKSFYDRFGDLKEVGEVDEKISIMAVCLSIAVHLLCFTVGFLLSHPSHVSYAKQVLCTFLICLSAITPLFSSSLHFPPITVFAAFSTVRLRLSLRVLDFSLDKRHSVASKQSPLELQQRFVEDDDSLNFLPFVSELLPFEKILFFRALFPFVLVGSLCLAAWQFCDVPARHWAVLKALLSTNRVLTERTQELIRATSRERGLGACGGSSQFATLSSAKFFFANGLGGRGRRMLLSSLLCKQLSCVSLSLRGERVACLREASSVRLCGGVDMRARILYIKNETASVPVFSAFLKTMGTPSVAALKAMGQQQQTLQSAAVRAKAAGVDIGSQQAASTLPSTAAPAPPYNPNLSELENFTARLTEEQREHFKRVIEEQYRRTEQEDKALEKQRARFDINWSQVLMWGGLFVAWLYYKGEGGEWKGDLSGERERDNGGEGKLRKGGRVLLDIVSRPLTWR